MTALALFNSTFKSLSSLSNEAETMSLLRDKDERIPRRRSALSLDFFFSFIRFRRSSFAVALREQSFLSLSMLTVRFRS